MRSLILLACLMAFMPCDLFAQAGDGRVYVRRIEFLGTDRIDDRVLRRELAQYEGTHINTSQLELSRVRLEGLPFVKNAVFEQRPVPGVPDQVDILITITEAPARRYGVGGAWSESYRLSGYGFFLNENLFGTGQRLFGRLEASGFHTAAQLAYTNPFAGGQRVSRTVELAARRFDQLTVDTTELNGDLLRGRLDYSYQIGERQSVRIGLAVQDAELATGTQTSVQLADWIRRNGNPTIGQDTSSTDYLLGELLFGWHHDTRDGRVFPSSGLEQLVNLRMAVPGSEVEYVTLSYDLRKYWSPGNGWTASAGARLGYGAKYGSRTTSLAPNLNWFAGGPTSVRGYRENRLGPRDSLGNPYGGNLYLAGQLELMMPLPERWQKRARVGLFYDIGNVFSTEGVSFEDDNGQRLDYGFKLSELRLSTGVFAQLLIPIGLLRLSYGLPLNASDDNPNRFLRDDVQRFQIAVGVEF